MLITEFLYRCMRDEWILDFLINEYVLFVPVCRKCGSLMNPTPRNRTSYRCNRTLNGVRCMTSASIKSGSLFFHHRISLHDFFYVLNGWRQGVITGIVAEDISRNQSTVSRLYTKFDRQVITHIEINAPDRIGGENTVVEIDECLLVKRKYRRGRILRGQKWVIGGVVRGDVSQYFVEFVPHRSRRILLEVIRRRVLPGTVIITDEFASYRGLERFLPESRYRHLTVNHSMFFIDPTTGANTQSIECFWSIVKRVLRKKGTNVGEIQRRLEIFHIDCFKRRFRRGLLFKMFEVFRDNIMFG